MPGLVLCDAGRLEEWNSGRWWWNKVTQLQVLLLQMSLLEDPVSLDDLWFGRVCLMARSSSMVRAVIEEFPKPCDM